MEDRYREERYEERGRRHGGGQRERWERAGQGPGRYQEFGTQEEADDDEWRREAQRSWPWRQSGYEEERRGRYPAGGTGPSSHGQWQGGYEPSERGYGTGRAYGAGREREREREREYPGGHPGYGREEWWGPGQQGRGWNTGWTQGEREHGPFYGRGPKGYTRSKERILDDVNQALHDDEWLDASDIEVSCEGNEVLLRGTVSSRQDKRRAEECAERVAGVHDVRNELRVRSETAQPTSQAGQQATTASSRPQTGSGRAASSNPT